MQTIFSNTFSWMRNVYYSKFHWSFFSGIWLTVIQAWFRKGPGVHHPTSHYLNQRWLFLLTHICISMPQWVTTFWSIFHEGTHKGFRLFFRVVHELKFHPEVCALIKNVLLCFLYVRVSKISYRRDSQCKCQLHEFIRPLDNKYWLTVTTIEMWLI